MVPPLALITAVLGLILAGVATSTESASVGVILLAILRQRLSWSVLQKVVQDTAEISSMIFVIFLGASVFSLVFRLMGGGHLVRDFLMSLPGSMLRPWPSSIALVFVLGFILDTFEIIFIILPITVPILLAMGQHECDLVRRDGRNQPANEPPDSALWICVVLSAWRCFPIDPHDPYLSWRRPVNRRAYPSDPLSATCRLIAIGGIQPVTKSGWGSFSQGREEKRVFLACRSRYSPEGLCIAK